MLKNKQSSVYSQDALKSLGAQITKLRKQSGFTAEEFGRSVGISRVQTLYKIEKGEHSPKVEVITALVNRFNTSYDELFGYEPKVTYKSIVEFWRDVMYWGKTELRRDKEPEFRVDERFAVLPFFSLLHLTDKVFKEFSRHLVKSEKEMKELFQIRDFFLKETTSDFITKEIVYQREIDDFVLGKANYERFNLSREDKISQLEHIKERICKYSQRATPPFIEVRLLEKPNYARVSFVLFANRIIFLSEEYFFALKNRSAVKDFAEQFNNLWIKCKHGEAIIDYLDDKIMHLQDQK